ncbi:MAG: hypothetical protein ACI9OI_001764 [Chitinophagales bacterium]|jgi:hypothetical protein
MPEISSFIVEKLANSSLLPAFSASIEEISDYFYLVPELC